MTTRRGLTLLELLIIIAVIGILIGILGPQCGPPHYPGHLRATRCQSNLKAIGTGVVTYKAANREQTPVMRDRPTYDANVNLAPISTIGCNEKYGMKREDGSVEDWALLGDNAMQNVWLMISSAVVKEKAFECPGDEGHERRVTRDASAPPQFTFGWTSPYQYSYSMHWPYLYSADLTRNPAPFNAKLENVVIFADRNPGGPVGKDRPPSNHSTLGTNVLYAGGSVEHHLDEKNPNSRAAYDEDDIYTNAIGIPGGIPQHEYDTSLNLSPR
jgi:competence protein ComGC